MDNEMNAPVATLPGREQPVGETLYAGVKSSGFDVTTAQSSPRSAVAPESRFEDEEESMESLLNSPGNALRDLQRGDVIEGIIARIDQEEVLVDIGQKSEGVIPNSRDQWRRRCSGSIAYW